MRVTIYQPQYFPRLHYFNRILNADTYVILSSAQYTKSLVHFDNGKKRQKSYQSDAPIKLPSGLHLLTVPVRHDGLSPISKARIDYTHHWVARHLATLRSAYGKTPHFDQVYPQVQELLSKKPAVLADLTIATTLWGISRVVGFNLPLDDLTLEAVNDSLQKQETARLRRIVLDSQTGVERPDGEHKGTEWTAAICKSMGASEYFHGGTAKSGYMELEHYRTLGISPIIQSWQCSEYGQSFTDRLGFLPNLSILDLLFNVDPGSALSVLTS